jgi:hypothetical protein
MGVREPDTNALRVAPDDEARAAKLIVPDDQLKCVRDDAANLELGA